MGTDIHAAIEVKRRERWTALMFTNKYAGRWEGEEALTPRVDIDRDYDLFAILGNVRNGHGFAGVDTGDGFIPMSDNRGLPLGISKKAKSALSDEHSATYVTLAEILAYDWTRTTKHRGWVNAVEFEKWDRMKQWAPAPTSFCGAVSGGSVQHVTIDQMRKLVAPFTKQNGAAWEAAERRLKELYSSTYCQLEWEETYAESGKQLWTKVMPHMLKAGASVGYDNVRLVMDFDS